MKTETIIRKFTESITTELQDPLSKTDCASVLEVLYDAFETGNAMDSNDIQDQFALLFGLMQKRSVQETDELISTICDLCRVHQKSGFEAGVKVGIRLATELCDE